MAKKKIDIDDRIISIYVDKFYGERLLDIQQRHQIKSHSLIYYYCAMVENYIMLNKSIRNTIEVKKKEYKSRCNNVNRRVEYIQLSLF